MTKVYKDEDWVLVNYLSVSTIAVNVDHTDKKVEIIKNDDIEPIYSKSIAIAETDYLCN